MTITITIRIKRAAGALCALWLAASAAAQSIRAPGAWETNGPPAARDYDGFAWYVAWLKPHEGFFTKHERNLFEESVTLNIRGLADAHEAFVNGRRVGSGGRFPPDFASGREGNHRHKIPPGLLVKGAWNEIAIRVFNERGPGGFLTEAPFVMDYFNECVLEGAWEFRLGADGFTPGGARTNRPPSAAFDQYHESHRVLGEAAQFVHGPKWSPEDAFKALRPGADFAVDALLAEPLVAQPTHISFDERGRMWVAQYRQYPYPAGLKMRSRDKYYRAHYDKVPPPPPNHDRGRDVISIHEDTDGDGRYDKHKVFAEGLNMANAAVRGRGGVWVMHTPYLLFYPDRNFDDMPDGPPEVRLAGFGLEDTHSVANGLVWGMDGWLYGAQGSTTSSRVTRPGLDVPLSDARSHARTPPDSLSPAEGERAGERGPSRVAETRVTAPRRGENVVKKGPPLPGPLLPPREERESDSAAGVFFEGCMVWRYHPETRAYEIFAEGSGNTFGLEVDAEGRLFSGHNGSETRGWHYVQGGYYLKQGVDPGKFGPPRNPYAFGELPVMKPDKTPQRFSHFFAIGEGTALPAGWRGKLFALDPVHSVVLAAERLARGATFETRDIGPVLSSDDSGFRPVFIVNAPDGSLVIADFYEHYIAHGQHYQSQIDPTSGRIYRLRGKDAGLERNFDLARKSTRELIALLGHPNKWHRHTAVRILGERKDRAAVKPLRELLRTGNGHAPLGALWALFQMGALDEAAILAGLRHDNAAVRGWAVRFVGEVYGSNPGLGVPLNEARRLPDVVAEELRSVAMVHRAGAGGSRADVGGSRADVGGPRTGAGGPRADAGGSRTDAGGSRTDAGGSRTDAGGSRTDAGGSRTDAGGPHADAGGQRGVEVRAILAASARRLAPRDGLDIVAALFTRDEDARDPYIPLLCWWVLEHHIAAHRDAVLALFKDAALWDRAIVREHILPRLMRRFAAEGRRQDLLVCAQLLRNAPAAAHRAALMKGFEDAFRGRPIGALPDELAAALADSGTASLLVRLRRGESSAVEEALRVVRDMKASADDRALYARTLGELRASNSVPVLLALATNDASSALRKAAFAALGAFDDEAIATGVLAALPRLSEETRPAALALLIGRAGFARQLLAAVQEGRVGHALIPAEVADTLRRHGDAAVRALAAKMKIFPQDAPADFARRIADVEAALRAGPGNPYAGEGIFMQRCAACHRLFFKGGAVGPDLTAYQRDNLGTMLVSILNPNAEIREGYAAVEVETKDGRSLTGFVVERDASVIVLRTLGGENATLRQPDIESLQPTGRSLMPEGLLDGLSAQQLRDFFAYLRSSQPMTR